MASPYLKSILVITILLLVEHYWQTEITSNIQEEYWKYDNYDNIIQNVITKCDWIGTSEVALEIAANFTFIRTKSKWFNSLVEVFGGMQTMNENIQIKEPKTLNQKRFLLDLNDENFAQTSKKKK